MRQRSLALLRGLQARGFSSAKPDGSISTPGTAVSALSGAGAAAPPLSAASSSPSSAAGGPAAAKPPSTTPVATPFKPPPPKPAPAAPAAAPPGPQPSPSPQQAQQGAATPGQPPPPAPTPSAAGPSDAAAGGGGAPRRPAGAKPPPKMSIAAPILLVGIPIASYAVYKFGGVEEQMEQKRQLVKAANPEPAWKAELREAIAAEKTARKEGAAANGSALPPAADKGPRAAPATAPPPLERVLEGSEPPPPAPPAEAATPPAATKAAAAAKEEGAVGATPKQEAAAAPAAPASDAAPAAESPQVVDTTPIVDLLRDALSPQQPLPGMLSAAVNAAGKPPSPPVAALAAKPVEVAPSAAAKKPAAEPAAAQPQRAPAPAAARIETAPSPAAGAKQQQQQSQAAAAAAAPADTRPAGAPPAAVASPDPRSVPQAPAGQPFPGGLLGITMDLTPGALVAAAMQAGDVSPGDWAAFDARHKQARTDSLMFARALQQAAAHQESSLKEARERADEAQTKYAEALQLAKANAQKFREVLKATREEAEAVRAADVARSAKEAALAAEQAAVKERAERHGLLDALRQQVNVLGTAFRTRSAEARTSHEAHRVALGVLALEQALKAGAPFAAALALLQKAAEDDPVVAVALASLPSTAAGRGLPTVGQLEAQLRAAKRAVVEMSYLPDAAGSGGVLAAAVAKLAASLKLDESKAVAAIGMEGGGVDAALAAAQGMLASGELAAAADVLGRAVRGTAAQHALANWLASVRARAAADQAMQLLQAHATSLASSVS